MTESTLRALERAQKIYVPQLPQVGQKTDRTGKMCPTLLHDGASWGGTAMRRIVRLGVQKHILHEIFAPTYPH